MNGIRAIVVTLVLLMVPSARAAPYYVSTGGNDASTTPTNELTPWRTITKAANTMVAGDTTYVKAGTYVGSVRFSRSGTEAAPIRLLAYPGDTPKLQATTDPGNPITLSSGDDATPISWITVAGFELTSTAGSKNSVFCIRYTSASHVTFRNNIIHGCGQGIMGSGGFRVVIDRNLIFRNQEHGIYVSGTMCAITNNVIYGNLNGYGIQGAGYPVGQFRYPGPEYTTWQSNIVANNTIAYNHFAAIVSWQPGAKNNQYVNNIFYENGVGVPSQAQGIQWQSSGTGNLVRNNLLHGTVPGATLDFIGGMAGVTFVEMDSVRGNPLFVNGPATIPSDPDFRLRGSVAVDQGLSIPETTKIDHLGTARPQGSGYDIGAFEQIGASVRGDAGADALPAKDARAPDARAPDTSGADMGPAGSDGPGSQDTMASEPTGLATGGAGGSAAVDAGSTMGGGGSGGASGLGGNRQEAGPDAAGSMSPPGCSCALAAKDDHPALGLGLLVALGFVGRRLVRKRSFWPGEGGPNETAGGSG